MTWTNTDRTEHPVPMSDTECPTCGSPAGSPCDENCTDRENEAEMDEAVADLLGGFKVGDRVQLHPATDLWMRGARFGTVTKTGRSLVTVELDMIPGRPVGFLPQFIQHA